MSFTDEDVKRLKIVAGLLRLQAFLPLLARHGLERMANVPVYCKHNWHSIGPDNADTQRCSWCNTIWKQASSTNMPKVQIGYFE